MAVTTTSLAVKDANNASQSVTTLTDPAGVQRYSMSLDTPGVAAYRVAASFTPFGTADRTLVSIQGSASKTIRVKRVLVMGVSTAAGNFLATVVRTTALGAGGTAVTPTAAKMDSGTGSSATAVVKHYTTAAQSQGTGPTVLWEGRIQTGVVSTGSPAQNLLFPEGGSGLSGSALVLRGTGDFFEIGNVAGNVPAGSVIDYVIEFEEDAS